MKGGQICRMHKHGEIKVYLLCIEVILIEGFHDNTWYDPSAWDFLVIFSLNHTLSSLTKLNGTRTHFTKCHVASGSKTSSNWGQGQPTFAFDWATCLATFSNSALYSCRWSKDFFTWWGLCTIMQSLCCQTLFLEAPSHHVIPYHVARNGHMLLVGKLFMVAPILHGIYDNYT